MLKKDKEEVEAIKHAKALEAEKAMYSVRLNHLEDFLLLFFVRFVQLSSCLHALVLLQGRRSRRQRREFREKRLKGRQISPPR